VLSIKRTEYSVHRIDIIVYYYRMISTCPNNSGREIVLVLFYQSSVVVSINY